MPGQGPRDLKVKQSGAWIKEVKETVNIPVIGNGDVTKPEQVKDMFDSTGCDAVMIGRGAIHNPWIFRQSKTFLLTGVLEPDADLKERILVLKDHYTYSVDYKGEKRGILEMRKHISGYLKSLPNIAKFRTELMQDLNLIQIHEKLDEIYDYYSQMASPSVDNAATVIPVKAGI